VIITTLTTIDNWFNEPSAGSDRSKLLSKLAVLELCGWLETEQDRIIKSLNKICLNDEDWTKREIIEKNFGFDYKKHFRPMLNKLIGEHVTRKIEWQVDQKFPGDIDKIVSYTAGLWKKRCEFAHEDIASNIAKQQTFDAPSWSINQHRIISKAFFRLEAEAKIIVSNI